MKKHGIQAIAFGIALALVSGTRLLCICEWASASCVITAPCTWLGCSGLDCSDTPFNPFTGVASAAASPPVRRLAGNPASARLWLLAGQAFFADGELRKARYCFARSVDLAPQSPPVLVEAAAFFHATGRRDQGLDLMSRALCLTRDYDAVIFPLYDRLAESQRVLHQGVPTDKDATQAYFIHLLAQKDWEGLRLTWERLSRHRLAARAVLRRYLTGLLEQERFDDAATVALHFLPPGERPIDSDRIQHGGFEAESSAAPLDWTVTPNPHAEVRRDGLLAWEGQWSLRIKFDGLANLEYRHVAQQAVVAPGRWKLSAWIRTEGITTDQGIGLRLFDARFPSRWQVWTENVRGDSDWTRIETTFPVPAATRLVQLEIVRRPSHKLDNKLGGVCWIDAVSLKPL
jgi:hypothetical protein